MIEICAVEERRLFQSKLLVHSFCSVNAALHSNKKFERIQWQLIKYNLPKPVKYYVWKVLFLKLPPLYLIPKLENNFENAVYFHYEKNNTKSVKSTIKNLSSDYNEYVGQGTRYNMTCKSISYIGKLAASVD